MPSCHLLGIEPGPNHSRGEDKLPGQGPGSRWVLSVQGVWHRRIAISAQYVRFVQFCHLCEVTSQCRYLGRWEQRSAIFVALSGSNRDRSKVEVDVFDPEGHTTMDFHSCSIDEFCHQARSTAHPCEGSRHL